MNNDCSVLFNCPDTSHKLWLIFGSQLSQPVPFTPLFFLLLQSVNIQRDLWQKLCQLWYKHTDGSCTVLLVLFFITVGLWQPSCGGSKTNPVRAPSSKLLSPQSFHFSAQENDASRTVSTTHRENLKAAVNLGGTSEWGRPTVQWELCQDEECILAAAMVNSAAGDTDLSHAIIHRGCYINCSVINYGLSRISSWTELAVSHVNVTFSIHVHGEVSSVKSPLWNVLVQTHTADLTLLLHMNSKMNNFRPQIDFEVASSSTWQGVLCNRTNGSSTAPSIAGKINNSSHDEAAAARWPSGHIQSAHSSKHSVGI